MSDLMLSAVIGTRVKAMDGAQRFGLADISRDRFVVVILAIAIILAAGIAVAWWAACQSEGMYPALDMPSWNDGGTWKAYCKK